MGGGHSYAFNFITPCVHAQQLCAEEWAEIADLEGRSLSPEENEHLTTMKRKFSVVLSADYNFVVST